MTAARETAATTALGFMTVQQLAEELGVPVATIYQWRHKGQGPRGHKFGRHLRFRRDDVEAWLATKVDDDTTTKHGR